MLPLFLSGMFSVFADDGAELTENIQSILDSLDLSELQEYLDEYDGEFLSGFGDSAREIVQYFLNGNLNTNYAEYLNGLFKAIFKSAVSLLPAFTQVVAITILCSVCSGAEGGAMGKTTAKVVKFACMAVILLIFSSLLVGLISSVVTSVNNIKRQVEIVTPILLTLTVLCGGSEMGAVYQPCTLFLCNGAIEIVVGFIVPATLVTIILNFMSRLNPNISFTGVSSLIKSAMKWTIGITVAVFSLFITVQSSASSLFNGIFFKVTKYLVGNSVPIVGNFLSSGVDMIILSGTAVKSALGLTGIMLLLGEIINPIIMLACFSLILKVTAAIAQPLGENNLFGIFNELSKDIEYYIAGILMVSFLYFIVVMLVINTAYAFI